MSLILTVAVGTAPADHSLYAGNAFGQSFTISVACTLTAVDFYGFRRDATLDTLDFAIAAVSGAPQVAMPATSVGAGLLNVTVNSVTATAWLSTPGWINVPLGSGVALTSGTVYTFCAFNTVGTTARELIWQSSVISAYLSGNKANSLDEGATWTTTSTADLGIQLYGTLAGGGQTHNLEGAISGVSYLSEVGW